MEHCSLCKTDNANMKKEINNKSYYFCSECNFHVNNVQDSRSREYIMKHTNTTQDNNLKEYFDEEIRKGILGKTGTKPNATSDNSNYTVDYSEYLNKYSNINNEMNKCSTPNNVYWTNLLRGIAMLNLVAGIIIAIFILITVSSENFLLAFVAGITCALYTLIFTASIMVFVEMSENTAKNTENTTKIIEIISNKH